MFFWNSLAFSRIKWMLAIWFLVPLPLLHPAWTPGSSWFMYCWSLTWRILSITLLVWDECNCVVVWGFFGIAFLWDWNKNLFYYFINFFFNLLALFQSCGHCWVFPICWHTECSAFTASSFRIWISSTGIPLSPLALFIVILPKANLILHSRMSGSGWVITPSWLFGTWDFSSTVFLCILATSS